MAAMTGADAGPSTGRPWSSVPAAVANPLKPALPAAIEHVIDVVTREVPAYSGPDERVAATLRAGVGMALDRLVDLMGTDEPALTESAALYPSRAKASAVARASTELAVVWPTCSRPTRSGPARPGSH